MTGRYKEYPEYKKPNIKFVNDIPTHWIISKFRHKINPYLYRFFDYTI